jgi:hypothetical protein
MFGARGDVAVTTAQLLRQFAPAPRKLGPRRSGEADERQVAQPLRKRHGVVERRPYTGALCGVSSRRLRTCSNVGAARGTVASQ